MPSEQARAAWLRIMAGNELPGDDALWQQAYAEASHTWREGFDRAREELLASIDLAPETRH